jgi:FkbM family methyltransferase
MRRPITGELWLRLEGSDIESFREIVFDRVYDVVPKRIQNCKYVIDLGANIGLATRLLATRYPDCNFLAVEPHPGTYELLEKNVTDLVRLGRCRTLRAAVWDRTARLAIAAPPDWEVGYSGMAVYETLEETVPAVDGLTITELVEESGFPVVDLLKVDIEGAEINLFRGDQGWLAKVHEIAIEFHGDSRKQSGFDAIMEHHGFQIGDSNGHTVLAIRQDSPLPSAWPSC